MAAWLKVLPLGIEDDHTKKGIILLRKRSQPAGASISDSGYEVDYRRIKTICKLKYVAEHRRVALKLKDNSCFITDTQVSVRLIT